MTTTQRAIGHFVLGAMNGLILLIATDGHINPLLLTVVSLGVLPAITLTGVHVLRITERRQLETKYNQPAYGEDQ